MVSFPYRTGIGRNPFPQVTAGSASRRWLGCRTRRPGAAVRLYCFPHAGGSAAEFLRWDAALPMAEVLGVQLPGRGGRLAEPAFTDVAACVSALVASLVFQPPFVFFGHSLGALMAYETARCLREQGREQPERLLLSAKAAPHHPHPDPPIRHLPDRELLAEIGRRYGGVAPEVANDPDLMQMMVRGCRGDFAMLETYRYQAGPALTCPFLMLGGEDDPLSGNQLADWRGYTSGDFELRLFAGGHFYLREQPALVTRVIGHALRCEIGGHAHADPSPCSGDGKAP